jgi:tryptophan synthase alpha chain
MSRIAALFSELKKTDKKALIPYVTAGDPNPSVTVAMMHGLVEAGADLIELGVPFSDPMADGPTIQLACERALTHNTSLRDVIAMVTEFRTTDANTPVVLMGYLNPVEAMGYKTFAENAQKAGIDGVLMVDMPPEESGNNAEIFAEHELDIIYLIAPTTTDARISEIAKFSSGYVYYVSIKGVTGSAEIDVADVSRNLERIRSRVDIPVGVGFGINNGKAAAAVATVADGVIVGSALVNKIAANADNPAKAITEVQAVLVEMRSAMDAN